MVGAEVWLAGGDHFELSEISKSTEVKIHALPHAQKIITDSAKEELLRALQADLVVFPSNGDDPRILVSQLMTIAGPKHWVQRKAKIALKTQDSHHQFKSEQKVIEDIDCLAIAHGPYLPLFPSGKVFHVPCAVEARRSTAKNWLEKISYEKDIDVAFPFAIYQGEQRNVVAYETLKELKRRGHRVRFGQFRYSRGPGLPARIWEEMARARVVLNLPLRNDLNIRTFEASLFPAWQVTLEVPDMLDIDFDKSNIVFASANSKSIVETIEEILCADGESIKPSLTPQSSILNRHMVNDRMMSIIDHVLETNLSGGPRKYEGPVLSYSKPVIEDLYTPLRLLRCGPTVFDATPKNTLYRVSAWRRIQSTIFRLVFVFRTGGKLRKTKATIDLRKRFKSPTEAS